jgi:hypothetical protein
MEGVDYAWAKPSAKALVKAGKKFACRYFSYDSSGKNLTDTEALALSRAGVSIVSNWEQGAQEALMGRVVGRNSAIAGEEIGRIVGMPANRPIYFSVDFDAQPAQFAEIADYFHGINSVIGVQRTGVYGGYAIVKYLMEQGIAKWGWQTYAWSAGKWFSGAHIQQYHNGVKVDGKDVDLDRSMKTDYGQWTVAGTGGETPVTDISDDVVKGILKDGTVPWRRGDGTPAEADNPSISVAYALNLMLVHDDQIRGIVKELAARPAPTVDPVALVDALAGNPDAMDALTEALRSTQPATPTAEQIAGALLSMLRGVLPE